MRSVPDLTCHIPIAYSVIEEIVEGFVEGSLFGAVDFQKIFFDIQSSTRIIAGSNEDEYPSCSLPLHIAGGFLCDFQHTLTVSVEDTVHE